MKQFRSYLSDHYRLIGWTILAVTGLGWLLLHRLGSLVGGLSASETATAVAPVGWHGVYHQPLYLPLKLVQSVVFALSPAHGQSLTRLPNAVFGCLTILTFAWLIRLWHGTRTAVMASLLFATSAWVLHASRLASTDVLYLWATPTLLLIYMVLQKHRKHPLVLYSSLVAWMLTLYIPGLVWLVLVAVYLQREILLNAWKHFTTWWQRPLYVIFGLAWLPLLVIGLTRSGNLRLWLGLPAHFAKPLTVLKQFVAVPVHLFIRGPQYPTLWLGRAPVLDVFALAACIIGVYFYATHLQIGRSRLLAVFAAIGLILVGLNGPVGLSLLVPILYIGVATGIAYLLREWLQVFPLNPLARGLGLGLVSLAVCLSCVYNLRAYFVAWPHNPTTQTIFRYRR